MANKMAAARSGAAARHRRNYSHAVGVGELGSRYFVLSWEFVSRTFPATLVGDLGLSAHVGGSDKTSIRQYL